MTVAARAASSPSPLPLSPKGGEGIRSSISIAAASVEGLRLGGIRRHRVIAGHVGEAAEVHRVVEFRLAGGELLVATGGDDERIAQRDGLAHLLPQLEADARTHHA